MILDFVHDKALKENDRLRGQIIQLERRAHEKIHQGALMNAARIALVTKWSGTLAMCDDITEAATTLAEFEDSPGFAWQDQKHDWEEVCDELAYSIMSGGGCGDKPWTIISRMLAK